jgi:hypothetical protein
MRWLTLPVGTFSFIALIGFSAASLAAAEVEPCGKESIRTGQTRLGTGSNIYIRTGPRENADKIINEKATRILKRTEYISIDHSVKVYEECTQAGWSKISVIEPDWLRESHKGWVPSKALRAQKIDSSGVRVFTEEDFHWDKKIALYKSIIIAGVNKIHRENSRCKEIDSMSAYLSTQGTKNDPVFFVTCGQGTNAFNVYFSKSEVEKGKEFRAAAHLTKLKAIELCESYAKNNATHPSTVDFSRVKDLAVREHPNGRTTVTSTFTAKNSFNLKLKHRIRCLLDGNGLIEGHISEAQ